VNCWVCPSWPRQWMKGLVPDGRIRCVRCGSDHIRAGPLCGL
jgi:hypothetical protein